MATALAQPGVTGRTLDEATWKRPDRDGYARLPGMLTDEQPARARTRVGELAAAEGYAAGRRVHQKGGTDRLLARLSPAAAFIRMCKVVRCVS